jgi:alkylation response protein AidB-like acyl-CoA dehydrogenase
MTDTEIETVDAFVARAETWLAANMPPRTGELGMRGFGSDEEELASVAEARRLQRTLFDGGFAGICFPREYGGQGLPVEYQLAFNRACAPYEMPRIFNVPTPPCCWSSAPRSRSNSTSRRS